MFIVGGVLGSIIIGIILEKNKKYKCAMISVCIISLISSGGIYAAKESENVALVSTFVFFVGFGMISGSVPAFDFGVELTYPVKETYSATFMNMFGNGLSAIITIIDSFLIDKADFTHTGNRSGAYNSYLINPICAVVALLLAFCIKEDLKRVRAET